MAGFQGKWATDKSFTIDKYDEFMDQFGAPELKEKLRNATTTFEYSVSGDKWTLKASVDAFPGVKTFTMTVGQEYSDIGMDGTPFKGVLTVVSDNKIVEEQKYEKWGEMTTTRTIEGDVMKVETKTKTSTLTTQLKRT